MQSFRPFVWLALVCVLGIVVGYFEVHRQRVDFDRDPKRNYPRAMAELYPGIARVEYLAGRQAETQALTPTNVQEMQQRPELMAKYLEDVQKQLEVAREHYERALAAGLRSEENLQYNYVLTLMQLRADPAQIEREIARWRRDFPHSEYIDLKTKWDSIQERNRKQDQFLTQFREEQERQRLRQELEQKYGPRRRGGEVPPGRTYP